MRNIVLATKNQHKLQEFRQLCEPFGIHVYGLDDLNIHIEVEETGKTFAENAILKAEAITRETGLAVFADDSGLEVDALDGAPGVYSARYAGEHGDDAANNQKLLAALADVPEGKRQARFVCAIAYSPRIGSTQTFEGTCEGKIAQTLSGSAGFGYDPLFIPDGYEQSFADLGEDIKNKLSHRAKALAKVRAIF